LKENSVVKVLERAVKDITILDVTGTFSKRAGAAVLHAALSRLLAENKTKVLLNFAGVTRVEPDAVAELLDSYSAVIRSGGTLKLFNLAEKIQGLIQITKLLTVFDVYDNEQEALSSFATPTTEIAQSESPADYLGNFFPISPELTLRIVETNTALIMSELESMADEDSDELGLKQDESFDQLESDWSEGREVVDREGPSPSDRVEAYSLTIRERLYQFLALLARGEHARSGKPYELFKVFPPGVRTLFGLENATDQFYDLSTEVTHEFRNWLIESGKYYRAPWGEMRLEDDILLRLTTADVPDEGSGRPYSHALYTFGKLGNRAD
jgi:anti-sigma B factor antagonist